MLKPSSVITENFPFEPTTDQKTFFGLLDPFLLHNEAMKQVFMLKGYAGTGKTTVIGAMVKALPRLGYKYVLMAPTGRAAKVMTNYSGRKALTVHKTIFRQVADPQTGMLFFQRQKNKFTNTVFIVDESSMISDDPDSGERGLLNDILDYVFESNSNKLIFVGDSAQLPPVFKTTSPALDFELMQQKFNLHVTQWELKEVMRQEASSGILRNATSLRDELGKKNFKIRFVTKGFKDIFRMESEKLEDGLRYAYSKYGIEDTAIICRSNKAAVMYNQYIRKQIHFYENELEVGDFLMIVKNNYTFLEEGAPAGFMANGDFVEIMKIVNFEEMHGFRFATLDLRMVDYPDQEKVRAMVMLDTLYSASPALPSEDQKKLYNLVMQDYMDLPTKKQRKEALRKDKFLNALQIKFAYALTCHKAQGGQWGAVFVDQGFLKEDMMDNEFLRWLYTATTRAKEELFLLNFNSNFF